MRCACIVLALVVVPFGACEKDKKQKKGGTTRERVAALHKISGEVSHRVAGALRWEKASEGMVLNARDAIKTGKGASATLIFTGGGRLEIDEQTLIIVERPKPEVDKAHAPVAVARVETGTVRGVTTPGAKPLELISKGGRRTRISATTEPVTFRVRARDGEKLEVAALKGTAKVEVGKEVVDLAANEAVEVEKKRVGAVGKLPNFPKLQSPAVDAALRGQDVKLTWAKVEDASRYRVQLARSLDFSDLVLDNITEMTHWVVARLSPGSYVWRVSSLNKRSWEGEFGFARRFKIAEPSPASKPTSRLLSPKPDASIVTTERRMSVSFRWQPHESAEKYELVVARRRKLRRRVARITVKEGTTHIVRLGKGTFYWGVYAIDAAGKKVPLFEEASRLKIGRRKPPRLGVPRSINRWR